MPGAVTFGLLLWRVFGGPCAAPPGALGALCSPCHVFPPNPAAGPERAQLHPPPRGPVFIFAVRLQLTPPWRPRARRIGTNWAIQASTSPACGRRVRTGLPLFPEATVLRESRGCLSAREPARPLQASGSRLRPPCPPSSRLTPTVPAGSRRIGFPFARGAPGLKAPGSGGLRTPRGLRVSGRAGGVVATAAVGSRLGGGAEGRRSVEGTAGNLSPSSRSSWPRAGDGARFPVASRLFRKCRTEGGGSARSAFYPKPPLVYCIGSHQLLTPLPLPARILKSEITEFVLLEWSPVPNSPPRVLPPVQAQ